MLQLNHRRLGLLFAMAALAVMAHAQGVLNTQPSPSFRSEGRDPIPFNVTCATATWTVVASSDAIQRSIGIEAPPSNTQTVCVKSFTGGTTPTVAVDSQCATSTQGYQLPATSFLTDYSRAGWACIASSGTTSQVLVGEKYRDRGDYGNIGNARGY